jgi:glycogen operon protein
MCGRPAYVVLLLAAAACGSDHSAVVHGVDFDAGAAPPPGRGDGGAGGEAGAEDGSVPAVVGTFPDALGAHYDSNGVAVRFRVYSAGATRIELDVYDAARGEDERAALPLAKDASDVWSVVVTVADLRAAGVSATLYYGYRAWGPNWPYDPSWTKGSATGWIADVDASGNRFDPNKLLFDPYAHELSHDPFGAAPVNPQSYSTGAAGRAVDSGQVAPKGIVLPDDPPPTAPRPAGALKDDVVYEVHVRGLTMSDPSVDPSLRGTYAGAATKASYLADLGVTAIELLPIHESQNDQNDGLASMMTTSGMNYWGYSTLDYFAPDRRYAADKSPGGPTRELRAMVDAFHAAGIKVFLDVVYNHTGEGGTSRLLSFRGLDDATYYELAADHQTPVDNTGTGGNFETASTSARDLILDSLHYWHDVVGADGFRFDLAPVLGNSCASACFQFDAKDAANALNRAARELPGTPLIAEPWAIGAGTYELGAFPTGWSEWNGSFRDTIRQAQNQLGVAAITPGAVAARLGGSSDLFGASGRPPASAVNYVASHDGFTLRDVYAYNAKSNAQAWPYGPSSGGDDTNYSWDQGGSQAAQEAAARAGLTLVMVAAGVPMITGGDEMYRTQHGNNNAYDLDSSANWLDWTSATTYAPFVAYARALLHFRAAHAALRPASFYTPAQRQLLQASGAAADATYLGNAANHFLAFRLDGASLGDSAAAVYLAYNSGTAAVTATLPSGAWKQAGDSAAGTFAEPGSEKVVPGSTVSVSGRSVLVLVE